MELTMELTLEEILQDVLICEKFLASMYEQYMKEASNEELLDLLLDNFAEVIYTQQAIFQEMKARDLYPVTNAEKQKIEQTITTLKEKMQSYEKDFQKLEKQQ